MPETKLCEFIVHGHAEPAGSKNSYVPLHPKTKQPYRRPNGGIVVSTVDSNPRAKDWKAKVGKVAAAALNGIPALGPVMVEFTFYKVRPGVHFRTGRNSHLLKDDAPRYPTVAPDVLKLARAIEDAMIGVVYKDDSQIVDEHLAKLFGDTERVEVTVWSL